jgi:hypothetical protein
MFFKTKSKLQLQEIKQQDENILNNYKYENKELNTDCDKLITEYNVLKEMNENLTLELATIKNTLKDVYVERDKFKTIIDKYEDIKFVAIENKIVEKQKQELELKKQELLNETKKFDTENKSFITKKSTIYLRKNEQVYLKSIIDNMSIMKIQHECVYDSFTFNDLECVKKEYRDKGRIFYWRMDKKEENVKFNNYHFYLK